MGNPRSTRDQHIPAVWQHLLLPCLGTGFRAPLYSPLIQCHVQQWALDNSVLLVLRRRCVQLQGEGELVLGPMHWEMLPVLMDFLMLSKVQPFLRKELIF